MHMRLAAARGRAWGLVARSSGSTGRSANVPRVRFRFAAREFAMVDHQHLQRVRDVDSKGRSHNHGFLPMNGLSRAAPEEDSVQK